MLDHILSKSNQLMNGCILWNNKYNYFIKNKKTYNVDKYIYKYFNNNNELSIKNKIIKTCNNPKCIQYLHFLIVLRNDISKKSVWTRLIKSTKLSSNIYNNNNCLLWNGYQLNGYGTISIDNITYRVHKVSYWIHNNYKKISDIPHNNDETKLVIRHLCNNSLCVEPSHLLLGTDYKNNYEDKIEAGTIQRGNNHYNSKINEDLAKQIKLSKFPRKNENYLTQKERALKFNVSLNTIQYNQLIVINHGHIYQI